MTGIGVKSMSVTAIDLRGWRIDETNSPYPEGSRDKYAVIAPNSPECPEIIPGHRYLMKFSRARYPVQFWSEIIAFLVSKHMNVDCPACFYAEDVHAGTPGSLISWFYGKEIEAPLSSDTVPLSGMRDTLISIPENAPSDHSLYIPGSSYMARMIPNYDLKKGTQHNVYHLRIFLTSLRRQFKLDYWPHWMKVLVFDSIIGNTDRHQDNWGVLWRSHVGGPVVPSMSPAFDNGTSLLHEIAEQNLSKFNETSFVDAYISRGRHHLRTTIAESKGARHIDLVRDLAASRPNLRAVALEAISFDMPLLKAEMKALCEIQSATRLSEARVDAICAVISRRQLRLREVLQYD